MNSLKQIDLADLQRQFYDRHGNLTVDPKVLRIVEQLVKQINDLTMYTNFLLEHDHPEEINHTHGKPIVGTN